MLPACAVVDDPHEVDELEIVALLHETLDLRETLIIVEHAIVEKYATRYAEHIRVPLDLFGERAIVEFFELVHDFIRHIPSNFAILCAIEKHADTLEIVETHLVLAELRRNAAVLNDVIECLILLVDNRDEPRLRKRHDGGDELLDELRLLEVARARQPHIVSNIVQFLLVQRQQCIRERPFLRHIALHDLLCALCRFLVNRFHHLGKHL